jgi:DNA-binding response OmpR family regulator
MVGLTGVAVLVVEDEPIVALDLASMLEDAGARVIGPAFTLAEAEALSENLEITVAVLDLRLGNQTVAPVATKLFRRNVPIIFHTGHGTLESLSAEWPDCRLLLKPARPDELVAAVAAALQGR